MTTRTPRAEIELLGDVMAVLWEYSLDAKLEGGGATPVLIDITRGPRGIWQAGIGGEGTWIANYYPDNEAAEDGRIELTITTELDEDCDDPTLIALILAARIREAEYTIGRKEAKC